MPAVWCVEEGFRSAKQPTEVWHLKFMEYLAGYSRPNNELFLLAV